MPATRPAPGRASGHARGRAEGRRRPRRGRSANSARRRGRARAAIGAGRRCREPGLLARDLVARLSPFMPACPTTASRGPLRTVISCHEAAGLPRVVHPAGEAGQRDQPGTRRHRRRRRLDQRVQSGRLHPRPTRRAHAPGGFRGLRLRPGRLDVEGHRARRGHGTGGTARQRRLRGRAVRRSDRHAPNLHPPCAGRQAADGPSGHDRDPVRPGHDAGHRSTDQPADPQGHRRRGPPQPARGPVVAAVLDRADRSSNPRPCPC